MTAWMLELGKSHWRLHAARPDAAPPVSTREFNEADVLTEAEPIHEALIAGGYRGEPIVVALHSRWCLTATLTVDRPQELRDRQTMLYRLEESIPWSIEECVADYRRIGNRAFMVAVPATPLAEFVARLEELGVRIQSITPIALLASSTHMERREWPEQHAVAFEEDGWIDLAYIDGKHLVAWSAFPASGLTVGQELARSAVESGTATAVVGYGLDEKAIDELQRSAAVSLLETQAEETGVALALAAAAKILEGQLDPAIELKRGAFGRTRGHVALRPYSMALQTAMVILVVSTMGVLLYRGHIAGQEVHSMAARQVEVFRSVLPNTKVPVGITSRLESELAKLKGLQGDDSSLPDAGSATAMLHRMLTAMPTDRRFRLLEIRIEEGRLYLDGEVIGHSDAEAIAQRLRAEGYEVKSPRTQRLDDKRVSLRITGTLKPPLKVAARNLP